VLDQPNSTDDENKIILPVVTVSICEFIDNSVIDNSTVDKSSISDNSSIKDSTVKNCSTVIRSIVDNSSTIDNSSISYSTINNSYICVQSTIDNSTIDNSTVCNSSTVQGGSTIQGGSTVNAGSTVQGGSTLQGGSTVCNSTIDNSTIDNSTVCNSTISNRTIQNLTMSESVAPTVSSVSSDNSSASYSAGSNISINVTFSESVFVDNSTGNPRIQLETGSTDRYANYSSGNSSSVLHFIYTVVSGDNSADLDYKSTSSLSANSGTIRDNSSNDATLTLPSPGSSGSLGANRDIVIDTTAPTALLISCSVSSCLKVPLDGYATVQSTETGTAYLVKTGGAGADVTVNNLASITGAADNMWNSVTISSASTNTNLYTTGLRLGIYKVYAVDALGNLSEASTGSGGRSGNLGSMTVEPE
jgi:hypothetical protein